MALKKEKNISISKASLFQVMSTDDDFILETKKRHKRIMRRNMIVHGFATAWQADVGDMFLSHGYKSFLRCVDIFSRNVYCRALRSKTAEEVQRKFNQIFTDVHAKPVQLETDRGSEFIGSKSYFKEKEIFCKTKTGANKASFAEHAIQVIYFICNTP